jgi:hypothetical protein
MLVSAPARESHHQPRISRITPPPVGVLTEDLYKLRAKWDKATEWKHLEGRVSRGRVVLIER